MIWERLEMCGALQPHDTAETPDLRRHHYRDAHQLGLLVLGGAGLILSTGTTRSWTFLFRTPDAVEDGVRRLLKDGLHPTWAVGNRGKNLVANRNRSLNPDLVFGNAFAIGDVKYKKNSSGDIARAHLNQVVTFAVGYGAKQAAVISFGPKIVGERVQVGSVSVESVNWNVDETNPNDSGRLLVETVRNWLGKPAPSLVG